MAPARFDALIRSLPRSAPRRAALGVLGGGLAGLLTWLGLDEAAAKKKRKKKRKKKLKRNSFGCVNVGGKCQGKSANCCSGICEGKKPKPGKKDKSRCVAHNVLDCEPGANSCLQSIPCGTNADGFCLQTTGQASFCGQQGPCVACQTDADCEADFGPGAACVVCAADCSDPGTACVPAGV